MLILKNICKYYKNINNTQKVLNNINLVFKEKGFISIIGPSGSGKTTLLNIIGGLDTYDKGNLIINGKSTKKYNLHDWDIYRNNYIGYVFQNYNLIGNISVLKNVEMPLLLNGTDKNKIKKLSINALDKVGLSEYINKKTNELSGGQMQRVAIARAIVNNPSIILADEPTGALDNDTSIQIMDLIKEISKDKLVIMVTHNILLAQKYSDRIISLENGYVKNDKIKYINYRKKRSIKLKDTHINFLTAIYLSLNNIRSKKIKFILTSLAISIGIIGISLILSLSDGFKRQIKIYEKSAVSSVPIIINSKVTKEDNNNYDYKKEDKLYGYELLNNSYHENLIDENYLDYINKINKNYIKEISYDRNIYLNLISNNNGTYKTNDNQNISFISLNNKYLKKNYDILKGNLPKNKNEIVIIVNDKNYIDKSILDFLQIKENKISYDKLINKEIKYVFNNDYYKQIDNMVFIKNDITDSLYNNTNNITLKIVGIIRKKENNNINLISSDIYSSKLSMIVYEEELLNFIVEKNSHSKIVLSQLNSNGVVLLNNISYKECNITKKEALTMVGGNNIPDSIYIYPKNLNSKNKILNYLDKYNKDKVDNQKIIYIDYSKEIIENLENIVNAITILLLFFSIISLIVSIIMIGIIIYTSVYERTKEIGILRSIGARKQDIVLIFNSESLIIGLISSIISLLFTYIILIIINKIIYINVGLLNVGFISINNIIIIFIIGIFITYIGGLIPSLLASKKNIVKALKFE